MVNNDFNSIANLFMSYSYCDVLKNCGVKVFSCDWMVTKWIKTQISWATVKNVQTEFFESNYWQVQKLHNVVAIHAHADQRLCHNHSILSGLIMEYGKICIFTLVWMCNSEQHFIFWSMHCEVSRILLCYLLVMQKICKTKIYASEL